MANKNYKTELKINLPEKLIELSEIFMANGYQLFVVGGHVRNTLLNISGGDIDICSNASADSVKDMLSGSESFFTVDRKSELGTIAVHDKHSKLYFEYTALRKDNYSEGGQHRPSYVTFVDDIKKDALRRDFTVGALYADATSGYVYDPLSAIDDLNNGIIRTTTKDPFEIIKDDGLRIMRMVRFACELGFYIDAELFREAKKHAYYLKDIAVERIADELNKIILSDVRYENKKKMIMPPHYRGMLMLYHLGALEYIIPQLIDAKGAKQNKKYHKYDVLTHLFHVYKATPPSLTLRLSGLLHDIGKPAAKKEHGNVKGHASVGENIAYDALKRLRYKNDIIDTVTLLIDQHMYDLKGNIEYDDLLEHLCRLGLNESKELMELKIADASGKGIGGINKDILKKWQKAVSAIENGEVPLSVNDLDISGNDIKELGASGKEIGRIKDRLWSHTIRNPEDNNKQKLIELVKSHIENDS